MNVSNKNCEQTETFSTTVHFALTLPKILQYFLEFRKALK